MDFYLNFPNFEILVTSSKHCKGQKTESIEQAEPGPARGLGFGGSWPPCLVREGAPAEETAGRCTMVIAILLNIGLPDTVCFRHK